MVGHQADQETAISIRLSVRNRVTTSHGASTSGTSRVLTVASLQRLEIEALIPVPADCEMRSIIKFLNAQSISPIEIRRQLCQVYGHTRLYGQHISCRSSAGRYLFVIHPMTGPRTQRFPSSLTPHEIPVRSEFPEWQRGGDECQTVVPIPGSWLVCHRIQTLVPRYDKCLNSGDGYGSVQEKVSSFSKNKTKTFDHHMDYYWNTNIEFYVPDKKISRKC